MHLVFTYIFFKLLETFLGTLVSPKWLQFKDTSALHWHCVGYPFKAWIIVNIKVNITHIGL